MHRQISRAGSLHSRLCLRAKTNIKMAHAKAWIALGFVLALCQASPSQNGAPPGSLASQDVLQLLNKTIGWYQHLAVNRQMATTPADILFAGDNRPIADQVVRLSFDFARASAQLLDSGSNPSVSSATSTDSRYQALAQTALKLEGQIKQSRSELDELRRKLDTVPPRQRKSLESGVAETQSELALLQARRDAVRSLLQFLGGSAEPGGLASQIDALERSVPTALATENSLAGSSNNGLSAALEASGRQSQPTGIWGILRELFRLSGKLRTIDDSAQQTEDLIGSIQQLQAPLRERLRAMVRQSDAIVKQPDSQDPTVLEQQKATLDGLTVQFKTLSSALLPLSKEAILLNVYKKNLGNWRSAVKKEYSTSAKNLFIRLLGMGIVIGIVLGMFELWRRAIFRYIQDSRRRNQFLLLRRIALWFAISIIVAFAFASELGSVATFAGLLTAGVAVALQNVILAVVGYFLLIGKFGVRVGDRVQISGVSGEVVEIGLIRIHVMELAGASADAQPTGRVVAFSNSIVFQPTAGLFRHVPGATFVWHEISITLASDSDYRVVEQRMVAAVDTAFKHYQQDFERLRRQMEQQLSAVSVGSLAPKVRLRLTSAGLEVLVRFPVEMQKAGEIDDRVTRELMREIDAEPRLKVVGGEVPIIRRAANAPMADASPA
jgi:small-conductance mechanosensitive channel